MEEDSPDFRPSLRPHHWHGRRDHLRAHRSGDGGPAQLHQLLTTLPGGCQREAPGHSLVPTWGFCYFNRRDRYATVESRLLRQ